MNSDTLRQQDPAEEYRLVSSLGTAETGAPNGPATRNRRNTVWLDNAEYAERHLEDLREGMMGSD